MQARPQWIDCICIETKHSRVTSRVNAIIAASAAAAGGGSGGAASGNEACIGRAAPAEGSRGLSARFSVIDA